MLRSTLNLVFCSLLCFFSSGLFGQKISTRGTGQTTGHIATISVENNSDAPLQLVKTNQPGVAAYSILNPKTGELKGLSGKPGDTSQMFYIPATNKYQGYLATETGTPSGETVTQATSSNVVADLSMNQSVSIPIYGYCSDIHLPPVGLGEEVIDVDNWISSNDVTFPDDVSAPGISVVDRDDDQTHQIANLPPGIGLDPELTIEIDFDKNPQAGAAFLFDAIDQIITTTEILQHNGLMQTPFSNDSIRELQSVVQQTFWIYSSVLQGNPYTKEDFEDRMVDQFETNSGQGLDDAPAEVKEKVDQGVDQFWDSFSLVGTEAKVLISEKGDAMQGSLPPSVRDEIEDALGADQSGVDTSTSAAANEAADQMGAEGFVKSDQVVNESDPSRETVANEVVHSEDAPVPVQETTTEEEDKCICGSFTVNLEVSTTSGRGGIFDGIVSFSNPSDEGGTYDSDSRVENSEPPEININEGDSVIVSLASFDLSCSCGDADCPDVHGKDPHTTTSRNLDPSEDKVKITHPDLQGKVLKRTEDPKLPMVDDEMELVYVAVKDSHESTPEAEDFVTETLQISFWAYCSSDDCYRDRCNVKINLKLKLNIAE